MTVNKCNIYRYVYMYIFKKKSSFHRRYECAEIIDETKNIFFFFLFIFTTKKGVKQEPLNNWRAFMMYIQVDIIFLLKNSNNV